MKAKLELAQGELVTAVKDYIQRNGWRVDSIKLQVVRGVEGDYREAGTPDTVTVVAEVTPQSPQMASAYDR